MLRRHRKKNRELARAIEWACHWDDDDMFLAAMAMGPDIPIEAGIEVICKAMCAGFTAREFAQIWQEVGDAIRDGKRAVVVETPFDIYEVGL